MTLNYLQQRHSVPPPPAVWPQPLQVIPSRIVDAPATNLNNHCLTRVVSTLLTCCVCHIPLLKAAISSYVWSKTSPQRNLPEDRVHWAPCLQLNCVMDPCYPQLQATSWHDSLSNPAITTVIIILSHHIMFRISIVKIERKMTSVSVWYKEVD